MWKTDNFVEGNIISNKVKKENKKGYNMDNSEKLLPCSHIDLSKIVKKQKKQNERYKS